MSVLWTLLTGVPFQGEAQCSKVLSEASFNFEGL